MSSKLSFGHVHAAAYTSNGSYAQTQARPQSLLHAKPLACVRAYIDDSFIFSSCAGCLHFFLHGLYNA